MGPADRTVLFTVVIPTYNREKVIYNTLRSIAIQSYRNFEVIVVDDGSKDNTENVVKALNDERFSYVWKENNERGAARNYGAHRAKGKYVLFLDSDDHLHPDALKTAHDFLISNPETNVLVCGYEIRDPEMNLISRVNDFEENDLKSFIYGNPFACGSVFVSREVLKSFNFCEKREVSRCEDWEFWIRLAANFTYRVHNKCILYVVDHPQRSIRMYDSDGLIRCKSNAIAEAFTDANVQKKFAGSIKKIKSYSSSYISLHLAILGYKFKTIRYMFNAFLLSPAVIFSRRSMAVLKYLIIRW